VISPTEALLQFVEHVLALLGHLEFLVGSACPRDFPAIWQRVLVGELDVAKVLNWCDPRQGHLELSKHLRIMLCRGEGQLGELLELTDLQLLVGLEETFDLGQLGPDFRIAEICDVDAVLIEDRGELLELAEELLLIRLDV